MNGMDGKTVYTPGCSDQNQICCLTLRGIQVAFFFLGPSWVLITMYYYVLLRNTMYYYAPPQ